MSIFCKLFGHKMYFDSSDIAGPLTCKRCNHTVKDLKVSPMPECKPPRTPCETCGK